MLRERSFAIPSPLCFHSNKATTFTFPTNTTTLLNRARTQKNYIVLDRDAMTDDTEAFFKTTMETKNLDLLNEAQEDAIQVTCLNHAHGMSLAFKQEA